MRKILPLLLFLTGNLYSQNDSVAFSPDFKFTEGLYLNFSQFRTNKPIPKKRIVSNYDSTRIDFIHLVTSAKMLTYLDSSGALVEINPAKLWGYCQNNAIYIRYNNDFNRIVVMGSLCHFTAMYTTYRTSDPTGGGPGYSTPVQTMQQYMLDMQTGKVHDFLLGNFEPLLQRDPPLYTEFEVLRKSKRRKMMFYYLRKYNEKHALYFRF